MSMIKELPGSSAGWSALNATARRDSVQRKALDRADRSGDGVGLGEQKAARAQVHDSTGLDTHGSARLKKAVDGDADGSLRGAELDAGADRLLASPQDTVAFLQRRQAQPSEAPPQAGIFGHVDGDADGGLRKGEFVAAGPTQRPGATSSTPENPSTPQASPAAAYERLAKVFAAADADGDNTLAQPEFTALKTAARTSAAELLGKSSDSESLNIFAAVDAYQEDSFDLAAVTRKLEAG